MIHLPRSNQKVLLISPQVQQKKRINAPEKEKKSKYRSPRPIKCNKSIQTEKSELIEAKTNKNVPKDIHEIHENLKLKYDKTKSVRYKINNQQQLKNNDSIQNKEQENNQEINIRNDIPIESVSFKTIIEFDMHGGDYHISDGFDWIQIIRDILKKALEQQIDIVRFIPGQGKHTNLERKVDKPREPILRALTLVTTMMLGYDSYIDEFNKGVVICPISTYHDILSNESKDTENKRRETLFKIFLETESFDLQNEELLDSNDDNYEEKINIIQTFKAVKKVVPTMIDSCIEIISIWKKDPEEAIDFAQTFMTHFTADDISEVKNEREMKKQLKRAKRKDERKREYEMINEMKLVNKFEQIYGYDRDIIENVVEKQHSEEKCTKVLDQIYHDMLMPYVFFTKYFADFVSEFETIPMNSLLDTFKECEYNPEVIHRRLLSHSSLGVRKALRVMKVNTNVDSKRVFNEYFNKEKLTIPKFVPSIEINLQNAGVEKAIRSVGRVMNGLSTGKFCEMVLIFADQKGKNTCCIDDIRPFIEQKADEDGYKIREKEIGPISEYHFYIFNDENKNNEE